VWLDKPSLQLAPSSEAMEEADSGHTAGAWEQFIINHPISCCNLGGLELIDEENSSSDSEDSEAEYDENEPGPVEQSRKQKGKQRIGNVSLWCCTRMAG
jgi:hypothetical protein